MVGNQARQRRSTTYVINNFRPAHFFPTRRPGASNWFGNSTRPNPDHTVYTLGALEHYVFTLVIEIFLK